MSGVILCATYCGQPWTRRCPTAFTGLRPKRSSIQSIKTPTATAWSGAFTDRDSSSVWIEPFTRMASWKTPVLTDTLAIVCESSLPEDSAVRDAYVASGA